MPKQPVNINFGQGLNTKADPWAIPIGQFASLQNMVFTKQNQLLKRNGYGAIAALPVSATPSSPYSYLTTFNQNLTALGQNIAAYNKSSNSWTARGSIRPMQVATLPLIRNSLNQAQCDSVIAANGSICTVYTETNNSVSTYKYVIADATTG
jgi:hypothetical protein